MNRRRTTRHFSTNPVPKELIEPAIRTAGAAPSGPITGIDPYGKLIDGDRKDNVAGVEASRRAP